MSALTPVQVVAVLSLGLKAGVLFGDQLAVRFARPELSPSIFVRFQQAQILRWERFMPALGGLTVISSIAWLVLIWPRTGSVSFVLVALAALASTSSLVLAVTGCLPVNQQLMKWSASSPPPDALKTWARWEQVNAIRTVLAVAGFVCVVVAFVSSNGAAA